jgi:multidrug efflux pump subunit AcrB
VAELAQTTEAFIAKAQKRPELGVLFTSFQTNTPRIAVEVDREEDSRV